MRFEAKHSCFKQLAHSLGNFVNLPYSLTSRHQQYQCYLNSVACEQPHPVDQIEVGPGLYKHFSVYICSIKLYCIMFVCMCV